MKHWNKRTKVYFILFVLSLLIILGAQNIATFLTGIQSYRYSDHYTLSTVAEERGLLLERVGSITALVFGFGMVLELSHTKENS